MDSYFNLVINTIADIVHTRQVRGLYVLLRVLLWLIVWRHAAAAAAAINRSTAAAAATTAVAVIATAAAAATTHRPTISTTIVH